MAATNPCPCGWRGSGQRDCLCDDGAVTRYGARVSGPLLDRIDLHVEVRPLRWRELDGGKPGEASALVRQRVGSARRRQQQRAGTTNARVADRDLDRIAATTPDSRALLGRAVERFALSARAARRVLKVARTIADLSGDARIAPRAMAEALNYRPELQGSG